MKKIIFILLLFPLAISHSFSQSFEKGNKIFDVDFGLGIYNTTVKQNPGKTYPNPKDTTTKSKVASTLIAPSMEWAVGNRISIGASLAYSHYLSNKDSVTGYKPTASGLDGNFFFNFHFVKSKRVDFFGGLKLGIGGFRLVLNDGTSNVYGSMGRASDLHFAARFYVSDRIGIIASLAFPRYKFKKFGNTLDDTYTLGFKGLYLGTGIAIKLGGSKTEQAPAAGGK